MDAKKAKATKKCTAKKTSKGLVKSNAKRATKSSNHDPEPSHTPKVDFATKSRKCILFGYIPKGWDDRVECLAWEKTAQVNIVQGCCDAYDFSGNILVKRKSYSDSDNVKFWSEISAFVVKKTASPRAIDSGRLVKFWDAYMSSATEFDGVQIADAEYGEIADGGQYADSFFLCIQEIVNNDVYSERIYIVK